jgi:hypothetical protein
MILVILIINQSIDRIIFRPASDQTGKISENKRKLKSKKNLRKKEKLKAANLYSYSEIDSVEDKQEDMYGTNEIYERDLMSQQQRRFGSPEYVVRNNSMMYELPTNYLEAVKPGVRLTGCEKPLKGDLYDENPLHQIEIEISESDEHSSYYEKRAVDPDVNVKSPIDMNLICKSVQEQKYKEDHSEEIESWTSSSNHELKIDPKNLHIDLDKVNDDSKVIDNLNSLTPKSGLSVMVPNKSRKVFDNVESFDKRGPMSVRSKFKINVYVIDNSSKNLIGIQYT